MSKSESVNCVLKLNDICVIFYICAMHADKKKRQDHLRNFKSQLVNPVGSPVFQTAYMPIKGKLFCFWCNFFVVFRFFLYVGLVKQLGDLKRKKTFLSLAKKRKCGFHPFFFEDLFNSLYEDTHFFSLRLSYLFKTLVVGWEISVKHKFCTYKESLRNFRDLLFRG